MTKLNSKTKLKSKRSKNDDNRDLEFEQLGRPDKKSIKI
jgi:hypothetical protein